MKENSQVPGAPATVSAAAAATGEIAPGSFVETDIDEELFKFNSDDTPLMNLMLRAKRVKVNSPEVEHYMIDEARSLLTVSADVEEQVAVQIVLPRRSPGPEHSAPLRHASCKGSGWL